MQSVCVLLCRNLGASREAEVHDEQCFLFRGIDSQNKDLYSEYRFFKDIDISLDLTLTASLIDGRARVFILCSLFQFQQACLAWSSLKINKPTAPADIAQFAQHFINHQISTKNFSATEWLRVLKIT